MVHLQHKVLSGLALEKFNKLSVENKELVITKYSFMLNIPTVDFRIIVNNVDVKTLRAMEKELNRMLTLQ